MRPVNLSFRKKEEEKKTHKHTLNIVKVTPSKVSVLERKCTKKRKKSCKTQVGKCAGKVKNQNAVKA